MSTRSLCMAATLAALWPQVGRAQIGVNSLAPLHPSLALLVGPKQTLSPAPPAFPLVISRSGRYLQDQNGVPFPILGDAGWEASKNLVEDEQKTYLADRVARGFNAVLIQAVEHKFTLNQPPQDVMGNLPFDKRLDGKVYTGSPNGTTSKSGTHEQFASDPYAAISKESPDFTYPDALYFDRLDAFIRLCAEDGVLVLMFPSYVGWGGHDEGWMAEMVANDAVIGAGGFKGQPWADNSRSRLWNYGAWIAQRYKASANLVWIHGGDYGNSAKVGGVFSKAQKDAVSNVMAGLKSINGQKSVLSSAHWSRPSLSSDITLAAGGFALEAVYSDEAAAQTAEVAMPAPRSLRPSNSKTSTRAARPPSPTVASRGGHTSTIGGYFFGNETVWRFDAGWIGALAAGGSKDMGVLNHFVQSIAWSGLVPSGLGGMKTLITAGGGTASPQSADYVAAAAAADGSLLVAYVPPSHKGDITVDMTVMRGDSRARWFNPTTAVYSDLEKGIPNVGTHAFKPPGNNGTGYSDWVLVLTP